MVTLIKFIAWIYAVVPRRVAYMWGSAVGLLLYGVLASKRRLAREALSASFPDWNEEKVREVSRGVFLSQGRFFAEMLRMIGDARDNPLGLVDCDDKTLAFLRTIYDEKRGVLVLTAHLNNYELLLTWAAQRFSMTVVTKHIRPKSLDDFFIDMRVKRNINVLPAKGSYRNIFKALKEGGCVGFVMDQNMKKDEGVFVTFFGRPANTTAGLAMLSAHAQSPVLPVCLIREGDRYRMRVYPPIEPPPDREPATLHAMTQRYSNVVEEMVREQPEGWIWMHKRWKTTPRTGEAITLPDGSVRHAS